MKKAFLYISTCLLLASCSLQKSIPVISSFEDIDYPYAVKKQKISEDKTIAYMDVGKGEPILFIHGLGSYAPAWKKNIEQLSKTNRCIAVDLPGYGHSSKGKFEASMSNYAEDILEFINRLSLESVTLAGHSMGGQISLMIALAHPEKVEKLILISPAGFETFTPGERQWFREILTPTAVRLTSVDNIISNITSNFYKMPDDALFMINDRIAMRNAKDFDKYCYIIPECIKGMVDEPVFEFIDRISASSLIIFGEADNLIPNRFLNGGTTEKIAKQGAAQFQTGQLHLIPRAGHFVHFEKAEEVNTIISEFLR